MRLPPIKISKEEASRIINQQIKEGREIRDKTEEFLGDIGAAIDDERVWSGVNERFAEKAFGEQGVEQYENCVPLPIPSGGIWRSDQEAALVHRVDAKILWLRTILKQIPL